MPILDRVRPSLRHSGKRLALVFALAALLAATFTLLDLLGVAVGRVVSDASATAGAPYWYGAISTVGIMLWAVAAGACLLAGLVFAALKAGEEARFFLLSAGVLAYLGADDGLLLHDGFIPAALGVSQPTVYAAYLVVAVAYVLRFRRRLMATDDRILLGASVLALSISVGLDVNDGGGVREEYFKQVGVFIGSCFWVLECRRALTAAVRRDETGGDEVREEFDLARD